MKSAFARAWPAFVLTAALQAPALAVAPAAAVGRLVIAAAESFEQMRWEDLVPMDWDPMKDFRGVDLGLMRDGDPRAIEMLSRMREVWDNAPSNPGVNGKAVRLPGFVVPLEEARGVMKEFLLVPYYGACIHTPPPPSNQIVHVFSKAGLKNVKLMDALQVSGKLTLERGDSYLGASSYRIDAVRVEPYVAPAAAAQSR